MFHFDNVNALRNARDKCRVAIRPASGRTVRFFKALSGVRRSIKPDAYLSSFRDTPAGHRSVVYYDNPFSSQLLPSRVCVKRSGFS